VFDYIIQPGTQIAYWKICKMPAAAIEMAYDGKNPFAVALGETFDAGDCNWMQDGLAIVSPALPGQVFQLLWVPYENLGGQGAPSSGNAS